MTGMRWVTAAAFALATLGCGGGSEPVDSGSGGDASIRMDAEVTVCERDRDCADELFCNGDERCMPGAEGADARGCVSGAPACEVACDEARDVCSGCDTDGDEDGEIATSCGGTDCDDADPAVRSGADELCDDEGLDEDCNPETIQSELEDGDVDGDGHIATRCFNVRAGGTETRGDDCDDAVAGVHPGAADGCGGGDEDCDGDVDEEGGRTYYRDADMDGFGTTDDTMIGCEMPAGYVSTPGDCDDGDRDASPARMEMCGGADEDCDGMIDESGAADAATYYPDADGDGSGGAAAMRSCSPLADHVDNSGDCNDGDARALPSAGWYHSDPHCPVGFACQRSVGAWDCVGAVVAGPDCPAGATSVGSPSWDFDCDGATLPPPVPSTTVCQWAAGGPCVFYNDIPYVVDAGHTPADCGTEVQIWTCAGTSAATCMGTTGLGPLPCH